MMSCLSSVDKYWSNLDLFIESSSAARSSINRIPLLEVPMVSLCDNNKQTARSFNCPRDADSDAGVLSI